VPRPGWTMGSTDGRLLFVDRDVVDAPHFSAALPF
jgi:hypothetical protein